MMRTFSPLFVACAILVGYANSRDVKVRQEHRDRHVKRHLPTVSLEVDDKGEVWNTIAQKGTKSATSDPFRMVYGELQLRANKTSASPYNADRKLVEWFGGKDKEVYFAPETLVAGMLLAGQCYSGKVTDCPTVGLEQRSLKPKAGQPRLEQTFQTSDYDFVNLTMDEDLGDTWMKSILSGSGGQGVKYMRDPLTLLDGETSTSTLHEVPDIIMGFISYSMALGAYKDVNTSDAKTPGGEAPAFTTPVFCKAWGFGGDKYVDPCGPQNGKTEWCDLVKLQLGNGDKTAVPAGKKLTFFAPEGSLGTFLMKRFSTCGDYVDTVWFNAGETDNSAANIFTVGCKGDGTGCKETEASAMATISQATDVRLFYVNYQQDVLPYLTPEFAKNLNTLDLSANCNTTILDGVTLGDDVKVICEVHEGQSYGDDPKFKKSLGMMDPLMKLVHEGFKNQTLEYNGYSKGWNYIDITFAAHAYQQAGRVLLALQEKTGAETVVQRFLADREKYWDHGEIKTYDSVYIDAKDYNNQNKVTKLIDVVCKKTESVLECNSQELDDLEDVRPLDDPEEEVEG